MKKNVKPTALGLRLKALRENAGYSKSHVARECGVSDVSAAYWERGDIQEIGHNKLLALAKLYGMTVSELLDETESRADFLRRYARALTDAELEANRDPDLQKDVPRQDIELVHMWDAQECREWLLEQAAALEETAHEPKP